MRPCLRFHTRTTEMGRLQLCTLVSVKPYRSRRFTRQGLLGLGSLVFAAFLHDVRGCDRRDEYHRPTGHSNPDYGAEGQPAIARVQWRGNRDGGDRLDSDAERARGGGASAKTGGERGLHGGGGGRSRDRDGGGDDHAGGFEGD